MRAFVFLFAVILFVTCGAFNAQAAVKKETSTQSGSGGGQQTESEDSDEDAEDEESEDESETDTDTDDMLDDQMDEAQDGMFM